MLHTQARDGFFRIRTWPPKIRNQNMATQGKKTAGYHLFRNVLPECNPILESPLSNYEEYRRDIIHRWGKEEVSKIEAEL